VIISGSDDQTVRVWDLATGAPVGDPFTGHGGPVNAIASPRGRGFMQTGLPAYLGVVTRHIATVYEICRKSDNNWRWEQVAAPEVRSSILAMTFASKQVFIAAGELGIVVIDLPSSPRISL